MNYQKKPITVEAIQYNNLNRADIEAFVGTTLKQELESETAYIAGQGPPIFSITIETNEGPMKAMPGDWIIKEPFPTSDRKFYPCKKDIFSQTYETEKTISLDFGQAIRALKAGNKVAREGWNGKGMYLYYVPANSYPAVTEIAKATFGEMVPYGAYIAMKTAQNNVVPWLASQTDMLAEDWTIVE